MSRSHCDVRGHKTDNAPCCFQKPCCFPDCPGGEGSEGQFAHPRPINDQFVEWIQSAAKVDVCFPDGVTTQAVGCGCMCPQCYRAFNRFKISAGQMNLPSLDLNAATTSDVDRVMPEPATGPALGPTASSASSISAPLVSGSCVCCDAERKFTGHENCLHCNVRHGRSADSDRGAEIHRFACDQCVFLLPGEAWLENSCKKSLEISGTSSLGFNSRCLLPSRGDVNWVFSSWLSDRMHHVAVCAGKLCVTSPTPTRGKPILCRHHAGCYRVSDEGKAAALLESRLAHLEQFFIGSESRRRPPSAPFTTHAVASSNEVANSQREIHYAQSAAWALRRVYSFELVTWGEYKEHFRGIVVAANSQLHMQRVSRDVDEPALFRHLFQAGVRASGAHFTSKAQLVVRAFCEGHMQQLSHAHHKELLSLPRAVKMVGREMDAEQKAYRNETLQRQQDGKFDNRVCDLAAEAAHAAGMTPITHLILRRNIRSHSTIGSDQPAAPETLPVRGTNEGTHATHHGRTDLSSRAHLADGLQHVEKKDFRLFFVLSIINNTVDDRVNQPLIFGISLCVGPRLGKAEWQLLNSAAAVVSYDTFNRFTDRMVLGGGRYRLCLDRQ